MQLAILSGLTLLAFAANSVLNRVAVGAGLSDAMTFALVRVLAGAAMLGMLMLWRRGAWPGRSGRFAAVAGLCAYLIGFSLAYVGLDTGAGALILFGVVQITMFAGAVVASEKVPPLRWIGAGLAFGGLILLLWPGPAGVSLNHAMLMGFAGLGWGVYSLAGRGSAYPIAATAANFLLSVPVVALAWIALAEVSITPAGFALAVVSGAVTSGLGYALWYRVLPQLGAARAAALQLTVPLIAAAGGALALGEGVDIRFALASLLVLGGVGLAIKGSLIKK